MRLRERLLPWLERLRIVMLGLFIFHVVVGAGVLLVYAIVMPPVVIGVGRLGRMVTTVEAFDFKWLIFIGTLLWWLGPIGLAFGILAARRAKQQVEQVKDLIVTALKRSIPIEVDIDTSIPIDVTEPLDVPIQLRTSLDVDEEILIEAEIPIRATIPIDTTVEAKVAPMVTVDMPVKGLIPVDFVIPYRGTIRIRTKGLPVEVDDVARVTFPHLDVPLKCRVDTSIDIFDNLKQAERLLLGDAPALPTGKDPS